MNELIRFLKQRNSAPRLCEPAPSKDELAEIFAAAVRAPDHAWLRPWRFVVVEGERRAALGEVLEKALVARTPSADDAARDKARRAPLRAPLLIVVVACLADHPKVPHSEQRLSSACAAQGILLGAEALGYAGIWRTGEAAFDLNVMGPLGLDANEEITGFLYLGTRDGKVKSIPALDAAEYVSVW